MVRDHERNTAGLKASAEQKKIYAAKKVDEAIKLLIKEKALINFNSVSERSGVSKAYMYNHPEVRQRIETLRQQQRGLSSRKYVKNEMTNSSKDVLLAAKNKRIKDLEDEVERLKEKLKRLGGEIYDNI
ncbi:DUF6262 family protein [Desulfosporosinus nitroreducens]|uniref:DUF6262 family protein n=1 Tax=Desulfosporosinus nitroreducens TaxID=2018668 RepID=A0ABT8QVL4_9FIRM|nr:DUF6262 family protein [Desulfosporosinus nitroreducens]MDO0825382.1 DUF6262 family protein [Desulfosporosinus nitroreducens]